MVAPGRQPLAGFVEVDETYIPLRRKDEPPAGGFGRSSQGKICIAGAVEFVDATTPLIPEDEEERDTQPCRSPEPEILGHAVPPWIPRSTPRARQLILS